jgi:cell division protein FtsA
MEDQILVAIDIGTTKICTLVAAALPGRLAPVTADVLTPTSEGREAEETSSPSLSPSTVPVLRILGVGIEPSQGMRKGVVVDLEAAAQAVARSVDKAERSSGIEILSAIVSLAGANVSSVNSRGVVGVSGRVIDQDDIARAVDAARAVAIPHNRQIVHVIQRGFNVDGQDGIHMPLGMHGYRLEVETHIITASAASLENLHQCVAAAGVDVSQFVLNPLASAEVVLTETERQMGVIVCDIGGGTTDLAIYVDGDVWHTAVLPIGGSFITSDIAQVLRLPHSQAEEIKLQHGHADPQEIDARQYFQVKPFGHAPTQDPVQVSHLELVQIINARVEEIFGMVLQEIKRSGYDGLLPAGIVLTGGVSALPGIRTVASRVLGLPVRIAQPENLVGMTDRLNSPAFSTSVGLLRWGMLMNEITPQGERKRPKTHIRGASPYTSYEGGATFLGIDWDRIKNLLKRLLP